MQLKFVFYSRLFNHPKKSSGKKTTANKRAQNDIVPNDVNL